MLFNKQPPIHSFGAFLQYLSKENNLPFTLARNSNGTQNYAEDMDLHAAFQEKNMLLYALLGTVKNIGVNDRTKVLYNLLKTSWANLTSTQRTQLWEVIYFLQQIIPADKVLTIYLALRRDKVNRKHLTRSALQFLFQHPNSRELIYFRRRAVQDVLEHVLGKSTARKINSLLQQTTISDTEAQYLQNRLYRFVNLNDEGKELFVKAFVPRSKGRKPAFYHLSHQKQQEKVFPKKRMSKTISVTHRGDIAANLVHLYRGGSNPMLQEALTKTVADAAQQLPQFSGKVALVLDASASTRGVGEREFALISQNVAFKLVLEKVVQELSVVPVGGTGDLHFPSGASDLAMGLIQALEQSPDLVLIVSDGHENSGVGDLEKVVKTLPSLNIETPIFFVHSLFYHKDDLSRRRPAPSLPELSFWHQDDFEQVLINAFLESKSANVDGMIKFLQKQLRGRLEIFDS